MTRVASVPMQRTLFDAIQRSQQQLSKTQLQLATGKKVQNYAGLGTEAVRTLSAHSMLTRQDAHTTIAKRLGTTLSIQDANVGTIESAMEHLRVELLKVIGTGRAAGLNETIDGAFHETRAALNANEGGLPMFAGSQTDQRPFTPEKLSDLIGLPVDEAFRNDSVRASARVAEGLDVEFGILASDLGKDVMEAFRTLAELGPVDQDVTPTQAAALKDAISKIEVGLDQIRGLHAENGRKHAQIETLGARAEERSILLRDIISRNEDADLTEIASELTQRRTVLEASYSVFAQLSGLSLLRFLN